MQTKENDLSCNIRKRYQTVPLDMCSCAPSEDSDQPARSLGILWINIDAKFLHVDNVDCPDCVDAQADLSLRWAHIYKKVRFLTLRIICLFNSGYTSF